MKLHSGCPDAMYHASEVILCTRYGRKGGKADNNKKLSKFTAAFAYAKTMTKTEVSTTNAKQ